jgi:hypothetical protein
MWLLMLMFPKTDYPTSGHPFHEYKTLEECVFEGRVMQRVQEQKLPLSSFSKLPSEFICIPLDEYNRTVSKWLSEGLQRRLQHSLPPTVE